jgi:hypothetical protein
MNDPLTRLAGYVLRRASAATLAELNERLAPLELRHADVAMLDDRVLARPHPEPCGTRPRISSGPTWRRSSPPLEARGLLSAGRSTAHAGARSDAARRMLLGRHAASLTRSEAALLQRVPDKLKPVVLPVLMAL